MPTVQLSNLSASNTAVGAVQTVDVQHASGWHETLAALPVTAFAYYNKHSRRHVLHEGLQLGIIERLAALPANDHQAEKGRNHPFP